MKTCPRCKETKPFSEWHKDKHKKDGVRSYCKVCACAEARSRTKSPKAKFSNYKAGAKRRGYAFDLTFTEFMSYWKEPCDYCGDAIETIGLDRIDNELGYSIDNVKSCCFTCNHAKDVMGEAQFLMWIEKVYTHSIINT